MFTAVKIVADGYSKAWAVILVSVPVAAKDMLIIGQ